MNKDKYDSNKPIEPIKFIDEYKPEKPIKKVEEINGTRNFAITKLTEGGKYVSGGTQLYYKMKDVEIYTELDNIIFVDLDNNSIFIRRFENVENTINSKDPKDRQYILLYTDLGFEDDYKEFPLRWESYTGRDAAYESVKINLAVIDIDRSIVLTDNVALKDAISVREFIAHLQNAGFVDPDEIILDEYSSSEYI